ESGRVDRILATLERGESVALVTDAGTPAISDPGAILVARVRSAGFRVEPIPGANAVVAAVSASGVDTRGFTFLGFPPIRSKDRKIWFEHMVNAASERLVVFYEAPHKLQRTLTALVDLVKRPIIVARELTKIHEEFAQGTPGELLERFKTPQGEFTILIPPPDLTEKATISAENIADSEVMRVFGQITDSKSFSSKKEAAKAVGERIGLTAKQVYAILERNK
ncbi:MAG TPA: SAM-dependent methyltransferase, partial [Pseudolabrys sp.]|nr:SAM-dependent methyltransferase [Pseudolabrys sp.]